MENSFLFSFSLFNAFIKNLVVILFSWFRHQSTVWSTAFTILSFLFSYDNHQITKLLFLLSLSSYSNCYSLKNVKQIKKKNFLSLIWNMVLPFTLNTNNTNNDELPRIITEEEQVLLAIDRSVHEVNWWEVLEINKKIYYFF